MDHSKISGLLPSFHDGDLAEKDKAAVSLHLEACSDCRGFLEDLEKISSLMRAPSSRPSSGETEIFVRRVMAAIKAGHRAPFLSRAARRFPSIRIKEAWLIPALGLGFAALLLSIDAPPSVANFPADELILVGGGNRDLGALTGLTPSLTQDDSAGALLGAAP